MICNFKTTFSDGTPTDFIEKIGASSRLAGFCYDFEEMRLKKALWNYHDTLSLPWGLTHKLHTIRQGQRWRAGMKAHIYTGSRTKQARCHFVCEVKSVQNIQIIDKGDHVLPYLFIDGVQIDDLKVFENLAKTMDLETYHTFSLDSKATSMARSFTLLI
tara:strand:+ start:383 stop:859 length:477 start_codon:yes stop_codon:yes gene_type:complete